MSRWTCIEEPGASTLTRTGTAPGWDLSADAFLPRPAVISPVIRRRIAHQVRQDLWRALRHLRGFVPVVRVEEGAGGLAIRAGGRLLTGRPAMRDTDRIAGVITNEKNQRRWTAFAAQGRG